MKAMKIALFVLLLLPVMVGSAYAVDLTQRISFGYNNQLSFGVVGGGAIMDTAYMSNQSFSTKWWATKEIGLEGILGFISTEYEDVSGYGATLGAKFHYNIILERQMNVYTGGGLSILPVKTDNGEDEETNTGIQLMGFIGTEFFLQGLPNLAFDFEIGLQYLDYDEYSQFGTYGGGFGLMGIRYYF